MDRTVHSIITALRGDQQRILESLGNLPKSDQFDHGVQVGTYQGLRRALEIVEGILDDQLAADANL